MKWKASLTQEPERAGALMGPALAELSLAEREKRLSAGVARAKEDLWKVALKPALERARKEGKLVLFFQLVGDLDLEGC